MNAIRAHLDKLGVSYSTPKGGEIFFRRPDGWSMYVRSLPKGKYDWSSNGSGNDTNHMEFRGPRPVSEEETIVAIEEFLKATTNA
jgi:hypothetical protein